MMVLQTIVIRIGGLAFGSSEYTFAMVVAVFVLCIARGSFGVSARARDRAARAGRDALGARRSCFAVLYFLLETAPVLGARAARGVPRLRARRSTRTTWPRSRLVLLVIGPAVVLAGATLPLLFHALRREVGDLGVAGGAPLQREHGRLAARRADRGLCAPDLARPASRVPDRGGRARARGVARHAAPGPADPASRARRRCCSPAFVALGAFPAWRPSYLIGGHVPRRASPRTGRSRGRRRCASRRADFSFHDDDPNTSVAVAGLERTPTGAHAQHPGQRKVRREHRGRLHHDGAARRSCRRCSPSARSTRS